MEAPYKNLAAILLNSSDQEKIIEAMTDYQIRMLCIKAFDILISPSENQPKEFLYRLLDSINIGNFEAVVSEEDLFSTSRTTPGFQIFYYDSFQQGVFTSIPPKRSKFISLANFFEEKSYLTKLEKLRIATNLMDLQRSPDMPIQVGNRSFNVSELFGIYRVGDVIELFFDPVIEKDVEDLKNIETISEINAKRIKQIATSIKEYQAAYRAAPENIERFAGYAKKQNEKAKVLRAFPRSNLQLPEERAHWVKGSMGALSKLEMNPAVPKNLRAVTLVLDKLLANREDISFTTSDGKSHDLVGHIEEYLPSDNPNCNTKTVFADPIIFGENITPNLITVNLVREERSKLLGKTLPKLLPESRKDWKTGGHLLIALGKSPSGVNIKALHEVAEELNVKYSAIGTVEIGKTTYAWPDICESYSVRGKKPELYFNPVAIKTLIKPETVSAKAKELSSPEKRHDRYIRSLEKKRTSNQASLVART